MNGMCEGCPRRREVRGRWESDPSGKWSQSSGPLDAPLAIIGNAPGAEELVKGENFVGYSGRFLKRACREARVDFEGARKINLVNCYPMGVGDKLTPTQIKACRSRFERDLRHSRPRVVVPLGADALKGLTGRTGILNWANYLVRPTDVAASGLLPTTEWIIPNVQPMYVKNNAMRPWHLFQSGILRAGRALRNELNYVSIDYNDNATIAMMEQLDPGPFALDIETIGFRGRIERIGISGTIGGEVVSGSFPWDPFSQALTDNLLSDSTRTVGVHNGAFDLPRLEAEGIPCKARIFDTMWAFATLHAALPKKLAVVAPFYLDIEPWKLLRHQDESTKARKQEEAGQSTFAFETETRTQREETYNLRDVYYTFLLLDPMRRALVKTGQLDVFEVMMETLPELIRMHQRGVKVDGTQRDKFVKRFELAGHLAATTWNNITGGVNPKSNKQLMELIYGKWKIEPVLNNKTKRPTLDKGALPIVAQRAGDDQQARALTALKSMRKWNARVNTYTKVGDFIHPSYAPIGKDDDVTVNEFGEKKVLTFKVSAQTGRIIGRNPNPGNIIKYLRKMYTARKRGWKLMAIDFDKQELRLQAALAGQFDLLLAMDDETVDIYQRYVDAKGWDRRRVKNVFYGTIYGGGPATIQQELARAGYEVKQNEIREIQNLIHEDYPRIKPFQRQYLRTTREHGYATNCFGRRRWFLDRREEVPEIINYPIQSAGADILWRIVKPIADAAAQFGAFLILLVHDEVVLEYHPSVEADLYHAVTAIMEQEWPQVTPGWFCPTEAKVGLNWGQMTKLKLERYHDSINCSHPAGGTPQRLVPGVRAGAR